MKEWHADGNKQADIRADVAADLWRVPAIKAKGILSYILNLEIDQDRQIAVLEFTLNQLGGKKKEPVVPIEGRLTASKKAKIQQSYGPISACCRINGSQIHCTVPSAICQSRSMQSISLTCWRLLVLHNLSMSRSLWEADLLTQHTSLSYTLVFTSALPVVLQKSTNS